MNKIKITLLMFLIFLLIPSVNASLATMDGNNWTNIDSILDSLGVAYLKTSFNSTYDNKTTLDIVNNSAQLLSSSQITGLDTQLYNKVNTPTDHNGTSGQFLTTLGNGSTFWTNTPPAGSAITYFLHNSSTIDTPYLSKIMNTTFNISTQISFINYTSLPNGNTLIQNWTSPEMNLALIPLGVHTLHINALKVGGASKTIKFYYEYGIVTIDGGNFSSRGTSSLSDEVTTTNTEIHINMLMEDQNINFTDRMIIRVWANQVGTGGNPDLQLTFDDLTDARLIFPSIPTDLTPILNNISILQSDVLQLQLNDTNDRQYVNDSLEPKITISTADKFWNGVKSFISLSIGHIGDFVTGVRTNISSGVGLNYSSTSGIFNVSNNTRLGGFSFVENNGTSNLSTCNNCSSDAMRYQGVITKLGLKSVISGSANVSLYTYSATTRTLIGWVNMTNTNTNTSIVSPFTINVDDEITYDIQSVSNLTKITIGIYTLRTS